MLTIVLNWFVEDGNEVVIVVHQQGCMRSDRALDGSEVGAGVIQVSIIRVFRRFKLQFELPNLRFQCRREALQEIRDDRMDVLFLSTDVGLFPLFFLFGPLVHSLLFGAGGCDWWLCALASSTGSPPTTPSRISPPATRSRTTECSCSLTGGRCWTLENLRSKLQ